MRLGSVLLGVAAILNVAVPQVASSHTGTDVPSLTEASPESTWVPDRSVQVSGTDSPVFVPGHWERRLSDHEVYTPPLVGRTPNGEIIYFPAGVRPPFNERQAP
jgi:hypothetical protein